MKYSQFFGILSDQCGRFANDEEVPPHWESIMTELRSISKKTDLDSGLLELCNKHLSPVLVKTLEESSKTAKQLLEKRLSEIDTNRKEAQKAYEKKQAEAAAAEKAHFKAREEHDAAQAKKIEEMGTLLDRVTILEQAIKNLTS